jgi:hypothetical protein
MVDRSGRARSNDGVKGLTTVKLLRHRGFFEKTSKGGLTNGRFVHGSRLLS